MQLQYHPNYEHVNSILLTCWGSWRISARRTLRILGHHLFRALPLWPFKTTTKRVPTPKEDIPLRRGLSPGKDGATGLFCAASCGHLRCLAQLLSARAAPWTELTDSSSVTLPPTNMEVQKGTFQEESSLSTGVSALPC